MKNKSFLIGGALLVVFLSTAFMAKPLKEWYTKKRDIQTRSPNMNNPLLNLSLNQLPLFTKIKAEHVEPAIDYLLAKNRTQIDALLNHTKKYTWENCALPLEIMDTELADVWNIIEHLNTVDNTPTFYEAYEKSLAKMTLYSTEVKQNKALYDAYKAIQKSAAFPHYTDAQKTIIKNALKASKLSGIELSLENQALFKKLTAQLSELESRFEQNVLQSTKGWFLEIMDQDQLKGLSPEALAASALKSKEKGNAGWLLTLDQPSYHAVMTTVDDRSIREQMYKAYTTKASILFPGGSQWDNSQVLLDIVSIRKQLAHLLGFENYCQYALENRMVKSTTHVTQFLSELLAKAKKPAAQELDALKDFAKKKYGLEAIEVCDLPYLSEKLSEQQYNISQETLRPYFPQEKVLSGLFTIAKNLYGISIQEVKGVETWDPDVRFFEVYDENKALRGKFFIDLYTRPNKRGGAWMQPANSRMIHNDKVQYPMAYLITNVTKAAGETTVQPTLFSHDEVVTLFHEFGHCLHQILTMVDYPSIAGTSVEWDAVELPSQLMENWAWEEGALPLISEHWENKTPLPSEMITQLKESKNFNSGLFLVRQLEFSLFDFNLHAAKNLNKPEDVQQVLNKVREETALLDIPDYNHFQNGFTHIFAGGYSAGYYSYLWSQMLSSDAYEYFKEDGLLFDPKIAHTFLTHILEQGGSKDFMEMYLAFRGKQPDVGALLRHYDLQI
ncbi:MAG: M3 family metallopeptidase [Gammaproteobacteria bacterium]|nr:M3 family metallopeptidase [Gammaproteobacteria bacterium]